jgi:hypothetical protein
MSCRTDDGVGTYDEWYERFGMKPLIFTSPSVR